MSCNRLYSQQLLIYLMLMKKLEEYAKRYDKITFSAYGNVQPHVPKTFGCTGQWVGKSLPHTIYSSSMASSVS